ncbi:hypothetical protein AA313_de0205480 [Arthrobotrys entomopaga]|nr:hypothetical protein AA313_de0205480 [Arthrobotrys entomopaga]
MRFTNRTTTVAVLTLAFTSLASASASILGIDYGTEFIKAALVKPGIPMEIVLTKDSKRKEVAAVAFKPKSSTHVPGTSPERLYGVDAVNFAARYPDEVYPNLKQLLGAYSTNDDRVKSYAERFPSLKMTLASDPQRSTVEFISAAAAEGRFTLEELIAMQLTSVRKSGEALANDGNTITDCVITVPAYFTAEERYAIIAASKIAGMNVLELMSDGVAVGLNYAVPRTFTPDTRGEIHVIYDMGAGSTTATVVQVRSKTVKDGRFNKTVTDVSALGVGFDRSLGGDTFNQKMYDLLLKEFTESKAGKKLAEEKGKPISELMTGKQVAKLWKEAARVRHILSANTEAVSSIESFFPDVDFRSRKIERSEFEELLKEYIVRISKPINDSVNKIKGGLSDIDSVIIFGGGVRAPFVQKILADLVGDKISKNVNGDEAAVMGATFRAASLSKLFRVKEIQIQDVTSYSVGMRYNSEDGTEIERKLFAAPAWRGHDQYVRVKATGDFSFGLFQVLGHDLIPDSPREELFEVTTKNLTASLTKLKADYNCMEGTIDAVFNIKIGESFGLPIVQSADIACEYDEKPGGIVDDVKGFFGFGGKDKDQKVLKDEEAEKSSSKSGDSSSTKTTKSKTSKTTSEIPTPTGENGKPIARISVAYTVERAGLKPRSAEEITASKQKLKVFEQDDTTRVKREEARNNLESFTYRATELLSADAFIAVSTEEQRGKLQGKIDEVSEWIYSHEADVATREILLAKLKELKEHEEPITRRRKEAEKRPDAIVRLETNLKDGKKLVAKMKSAVEKHTKDIASWSSYSTSFVSSVSSAEAVASASSAAAEAEASKSAEEAASASSDSASSSTTESPAPSESKVDDLEDSSSSSSSTTKSTKSTKSKPKSTKKPTPTPAPVSLYTETDISDLETAIADNEKWLAAKQKEQDALKAHEDPTLLSADLTTRSQKLEKEIRKLSGRKKSTYVPPPPPPPKKAPMSKERKARIAEARKKLNFADVEGVEGFQESIVQMLENMSDEELEKIIEKVTKEEEEKKKKAEEEGKEKAAGEEVPPTKEEAAKEEEPVKPHDEL